MAQPASLRRASFCFKGSLLLGFASSAVLLLGGCDTDSGKADKSVTSQLDSAGSMPDPNLANNKLATAAGDTTASLPVQLRAKVLLADSELQLAQDTVTKIQSNDAQIDQLVRAIGLLGNEIQSNNLTIAALAKYQPTGLQDAVTQKKNDVTGSDTKPDWYKSDAGTLPALTADDSQIKDLQGKISQLQDTIKTESDQRNQLLDQADKLTQQSQRETKQKSVDLYVQGSDARKQAANLTVKLDNDNAALARQQADLTVLQGQHDSLSTALKSLDAKSSSFDANWKTVQAEQAALTEDSKNVLGDDPVSLPEFDKDGDFESDKIKTIGTKAALIAHPSKGLAKTNHDLRALAETHFNNAIAKYGEAVRIAKEIQSDLGQRASKADPQKPDQIAWKQEQEVLDPNTYRFHQATAQLQAAEFFARSATEAKVRLDMIQHLKPIIQEAGFPLFSSLDDADGTIADQLKNAQKSARDFYKDSAELLQNIYEGTAPLDQKSAAQIQAIFAQYGWYVLENSTGDPADAQDAPNHLSFARNDVSAAVSAGMTLPPLPPELASSAASSAATPAAR